jgi:hypothetical protein
MDVFGNNLLLASAVGYPTASDVLLVCSDQGDSFHSVVRKVDVASDFEISIGGVM